MQELQDTLQLQLQVTMLYSEIVFNEFLVDWHFPLRFPDLG